MRVPAAGRLTSKRFLRRWPGVGGGVTGRADLTFFVPLVKTRNKERPPQRWWAHARAGKIGSFVENNTIRAKRRRRLAVITIAECAWIIIYYVIIYLFVLSGEIPSGPSRHACVMRVIKTRYPTRCTILGFDVSLFAKLRTFKPRTHIVYLLLF